MKHGISPTTSHKRTSRFLWMSKIFIPARAERIVLEPDPDDPTQRISVRHPATPAGWSRGRTFNVGRNAAKRQWHKYENSLKGPRSTYQ
jgi:hypothetical protein